MMYSLCGELFPSSQRTFVAASIGSSANVGAAIGSMLASLASSGFETFGKVGKKLTQKPSSAGFKTYALRAKDSSYA